MVPIRNPFSATTFRLLSNQGGDFLSNACLVTGDFRLHFCIFPLGLRGASRNDGARFRVGAVLNCDYRFIAATDLPSPAPVLPSTLSSNCSLNLHPLLSILSTLSLPRLQEYVCACVHAGNSLRENGFRTVLGGKSPLSELVAHYSPLRRDSSNISV